MSDGPDPAGVIRDEDTKDGVNLDGVHGTDTENTQGQGQAWAKKAAVAGPKSLLDMDPSTGFSGWSTVSVEVVDEAAQERQEKLRLQEEAELRSKETQAKLRNIELERLSAIATDNVLANVDPYGTGVYKGLFVGDMEQIREADMPSLSQGAVVGFKKRRRPGQEALSASSTTASDGSICLGTTNMPSSSSSSSSSSSVPATAAAAVTISTAESKESVEEDITYSEPPNIPIATVSSVRSTITTATAVPVPVPVKISMSFKGGSSGGQKPTRQKVNHDDD